MDVIYLGKVGKVVSRLGHCGEEGHEGEGLEHLPQEERPRHWPRLPWINPHSYFLVLKSLFASSLTSLC